MRLATCRLLRPLLKGRFSLLRNTKYLRIYETVIFVHHSYFVAKEVLTKSQKKEQVAAGVEEIKKAKSMIFADFTGVSIAETDALKKVLRGAGAKFKVFKKRLLKIAIQEAGVAADPTQFDRQVGTVFATNTIYDIAGTVQKFSKDLLKKSKKDFKILGAYDAAEKQYFDASHVVTIAKLPPRAVLLAQIAMMLTMPIKKVMVGLNSRKEQLEKQTV